jgi:hypothetical protein
LIHLINRSNVSLNSIIIIQWHKSIFKFFKFYFSLLELFLLIFYLDKWWTNSRWKHCWKWWIERSLLRKIYYIHILSHWKSYNVYRLIKNGLRFIKMLIGNL